MIALLDTVILDVGPCLPWLQILLSSPFLLIRLLLRNQLIVLWELLCRWLCSFLLLLLRFSLYHIVVLREIQIMCLDVALNGSNLFRTLWASWTCMSISFVKWGKLSLFFQISFQFLPLPFLLLASLWFGCWHFWRCPRVFLFSLRLFEFLFLHFVLVDCLFLSYVPNH